MTDERARTAYHEAGHLVIGSLFGFPCSSVSIRPDEERGSLGRVIPLEGPESRSYRFDADEAEGLCEIARGESTEADLGRYRALRDHARHRAPEGSA